MRTLICTTVLFASSVALTLVGGCSHQQPMANESTLVTWQNRQATSMPAYNAGPSYRVAYAPKFTPLPSE